MKHLLLTVMSALFYVLLTTPTAWARPVSYPGGWTTMLTNDGDKSAIHLHYSPTAKYSVGYKMEYWRDSEYTLHALQLNNLLKRWNSRDAQANLYLKSGIGFAYSDYGSFDGETEPAAFTGMAMDWENRRFLAAYENRITEAGSIDDFFMQSGRVGIAPYIGDYGDLHTWIMLQVDHNPEKNEPVTLTPLVRLFKGVNLVEAGISTKGEVLLNWVMRF